MFFLFDEIRILIAQNERLIDTIGKLAHAVGENTAQLQVIQAIDRQILSQQSKIVDIFTPKPTYTIITLGELGGTMPLLVGQSSEATVVVLDQFGQPMTGFDFTANPPVFSLSDPNAASLAAGPTPDKSEVTGVAAGSEILSVHVPGVVNGDASLTFSVVPAAATPTSVSLSTNPDISG